VSNSTIALNKQTTIQTHKFGNKKKKMKFKSTNNNNNNNSSVKQTKRKSIEIQTNVLSTYSPPPRLT
jgi:hypothetical protein